jgi:Protein of unknown function DUF2617
MNAQTKGNSLQSYQVLLYGRALHPELFPLRSRQVRRHGIYEVEAWAMNGSHLLRFEHRTLCACELVTDQDKNLPTTGVVSAFLCAGDHDFEHAFKKDHVHYMNTVQTEALSENLYNATYDELIDHGRELDALIHRWNDDTGPCVSIVAVQTFTREAHVQAFHMVATGGVVLRTQTLFEIK